MISDIKKVKDEIARINEENYKYFGNIYGVKIFYNSRLQDDEWAIIAGKNAFNKIVKGTERADNG